MKDKLLAEIISFRDRGNGDEIHGGKDVVLEVTDVTTNGLTEVAFDDPVSKVRHYLRFDFGELARRVTMHARAEG